MFRCTSTPSSGEHSEHLKSTQAQLLKLLKHHLLTQYVEILCKMLVGLKLFNDKSSAAEYKHQVILIWPAVGLVLQNITKYQ
jgi:hypothetical protein